MTHKHVYSLNERNLNTRTERKNYVHGVKRKETKKREKWEKGGNTNNRCFMIIKCNLNKVVVYKNVYACMCVPMPMQYACAVKCIKMQCL